MQAKDFITQVEAACRRRAKTADGRRLTGNHVLVARKLAFSLSHAPKHRELAAKTGLSTKTVQRALAILHELGLLSWTRRVLKGPGWRAQIANAYELLSSKALTYLGIKTSVKMSTPVELGDLLKARNAEMLRKNLELQHGKEARWREQGFFQPGRGDQNGPQKQLPR